VFQASIANPLENIAKANVGAGWISCRSRGSAPTSARPRSVPGWIVHKSLVCLVFQTSRDNPPENTAKRTVGAGLLAKASCQSTSMLADRPLSRASPLPQGMLRQGWISCRNRDSAPTNARSRSVPDWIAHKSLVCRVCQTSRDNPFKNIAKANVGAGLLAKASCQSTSMLNSRPLSRAGSLPQGMLRPGWISCRNPDLAPTSARPRSVPGWIVHKSLVCHMLQTSIVNPLENTAKRTVGASLLAKAACRSTSMLNDRPLSRASPLPQEMLRQDWISCRSRGSAPASVRSRSVPGLCARCS
jgi:hypothetical protein